MVSWPGDALGSLIQHVNVQGAALSQLWLPLVGLIRGLSIASSSQQVGHVH